MSVDTNAEQLIEVQQEGKKTSIKIQLDVFVREEKQGMYVSFCPSLDLYSQGDTMKEATENIKEATSLFLNSCLERKTLDKVLLELGFQISQKPSDKPQVTSTAFNGGERIVFNSEAEPVLA